MFTRSAIIALLALAACGSKDKEAPPAPGSADSTAAAPTEHKHKKHDDTPHGTPRPQSKLTVTLDGKPVAMVTALAWREWDGDIRVTASSVPVGCDDVTGDMRSIHDGEVTFDISVGNSLQPDGKAALQLRAMSFGGMTQSQTSPATGSGDATPGQPMTVDVDFTIADTSTPKKNLVVKGTLDALGCAAPAHASPPLPPESGATLTIAGKTLPIRGAFISKIGDWPELKLTTGTEGCKQVPYATPGELSATLTWMKAGDAVPSQVTLGGSLLGNPGGDQTFDKKKLTVTPGPAVAGPVVLAGDIVVMKYPVKLDGKVTAIECPKQ